MVCCFCVGFGRLGNALRCWVGSGCGTGSGVCEARSEDGCTTYEAGERGHGEMLEEMLGSISGRGIGDSWCEREKKLGTEAISCTCRISTRTRSLLTRIAHGRAQHSMIGSSALANPVVETQSGVTNGLYAKHLLIQQLGKHLCRFSLRLRKGNITEGNIL